MRLQQSSDAEESQSDWPATEKARVRVVIQIADM